MDERIRTSDYIPFRYWYFIGCFYILILIIRLAPCSGHGGDGGIILFAALFCHV